MVISYVAARSGVHFIDVFARAGRRRLHAPRLPEALAMATGPHLILFYDYVADIVERRAAHREAHLARIGEWVGRRPHRDGRGARRSADRGRHRLRGTSADEVEAFADADPYVAAGLVTGRRVVPWTVVASA